MSQTNISVVGLGKLGEPFAICLASRGFRVLGVDIDEDKVVSLNAGIVTVQEPRAQTLLSACHKQFSATTDHGQAIAATDATFLLVSTPSDTDGRFSTRYLKPALLELCEHLKQSDKPYHLFVIGSTVMPGACAELTAIVKEHSGRDEGGFGIAYVPEFVQLGNVVNGFLVPDFVVIGGDDARAVSATVDIYEYFNPIAPKHVMTLVEAEVFKVALNFFLTLKISFANTLGRICEQYPGVDVDVVAGALGLDSRINPRFMKAGPPFGGYCFPRDAAAFGRLGFPDLPSPGELLSEAVLDINAKTAWHVAHQLPDVGSAAVLGLSFKPGTTEIEESPGMRLVEVLSYTGARPYVYDPLAMDNARAVLPDTVEFCETAKECAAASSVVVLMMPCDEYGALEEDDFQEGALVVDCWRQLKRLRHSERINYYGLGMGK